MNRNGAIVVAENLCKDFRVGTSRVEVLKGIDLEITEGEIVAIVGPSGVGKSTLLHILGTLDQPTAGSVEIDHLKVFEFDDKKLANFRNQTVGFVFQFHHLLPEFTAAENVMMPSLISGNSKDKVMRRAADLLEEVGLSHRMNHRPGELSGGEQQRAAVARALMNRPRIVLADEPSGNLDEAASSALHDLLWGLSHKFQMTLVIVTHNRELAAKADKVVELLDGRIKNEQLNPVL